MIAEGIPANAPLAVGATNNGTVTINENGGIFNAALRPTNHWDLNGTVEALYDDNAFTPVGSAANQALQSAYHVQAKALGDGIGRL